MQIQFHRLVDLHSNTEMVLVLLVHRPTLGSSVLIELGLCGEAGP